MSTHRFNKDLSLFSQWIPAYEWAPWDAYISTKEPDRLFEEYRLNAVAFRKPIHNNSDDLGGFEIEDADGYVLYFGRPNS